MEKKKEFIRRTLSARFCLYNKSLSQKRCRRGITSNVPPVFFGLTNPFLDLRRFDFGGGGGLCGSIRRSYIDLGGWQTQEQENLQHNVYSEMLLSFLRSSILLAIVLSSQAASSLMHSRIRSFRISRHIDSLVYRRNQGGKGDFLRLHATSHTSSTTSSATSTSSTSKQVVRPPEFASEADAKYFDFERLEKDVYTWWESAGYFQPSCEKDKKPFVIPMPPPNVTGYLHMGHAMFVALQDIMARFHRMRGKATLWLPGTDHAGIATQLLVERALTAAGTSRQALGRESFLERVWQWKEEKGGYITKQMRRLGASADWSRERFTLEPTMSESVTEAFVRLHEKGLVYKGNYMVNWSPNLQTAVSDLEVEYSEEMGKLFFFKYELSDGSGFIPVSTTRPETILGDTAVCVHPDDERYKKWIGKMVKVPMCNREVPVIADEYVDREFGTGALKITPAHDPNDYEIGKRFNLPSISIMNKDASINSQGGARYEGLDRFVCRESIWQDMEAAGLTIKVEPHMQRVPRSQRGGEVIEPMVSGQWFVRMENMGKRAVEAVRNKDIVIIPDRFEKVWYNWLENIHDWCVSRQLWWGHRIPAYYVDGSRTEYVVARTEAEAHKIAREKYGKDVPLNQDEDVLDTWFRQVFCC